MAKKAGSNALSFKVRVYNDAGVVDRRATIISRDDFNVTIRYKKPRSSVYAIRPIPASSVILIETGSDKGSRIIYKGRQLVAEFKGIVESDPKSGMLKITADDGRVIYAHPSMVDAEADDRSDNPAADGAKKKGVKKPAAGKAKKA